MKRTFGRSSATGSSDLRVLFDGWPLVRDFGSPAALHLLELLEALPPEIEPWIALPGDPPDLLFKDRPQMAIRRVAGIGSSARLRWEQFDLPRLAQQIGSHLLHITTSRPPLNSPVPCLVSPAELFPRDFSPPGFFSRLGSALGSGGFSGIAGLLWPADLPAPLGLPARIPVRMLPPRVHSAFLQPQPRLERLPDSYIYSPAPLLEDDLFSLVSAWERISAALGEEWTLLVDRMSSSAYERLLAFCRDQEIAAPVANLPLHTPEERAAAVQHAAVVLRGSPVLPWGDALLQALSCARPLAAVETPASDQRVGPAGYLASPGDARTLASAVITLVVEEPVAEQLCQAAQARSSAWDSRSFPERLAQIYSEVSGRPAG